MPLPTAADCWPVVADRRPSPLAPRCRPPWRAGHLPEVRGAKITAFSVPTNFSLRNLSPVRRGITSGGAPCCGGITVEGPAARKPAELPCSRCRGGIVARRTAAEGTAARKPHRTAALPLPRRHCRPKGASSPKGPPPGGVPCPEAPQNHRAPAAAEASRPEGHHRRRNRPLSGIASGGASHFCSRPSKLPARRSCPLCRRPSKLPAPRRKSSKQSAIAADRRTGG